MSTSNPNTNPNPPQSYTTALYRSVQTNTLSPPTQTWLARVLYALDTKDIDTYCSFFHPNATITFNNGLPGGAANMVGIEAIRTGLTQYWGGFESIRHEELNVMEVKGDGLVVHEALNHYETLGGEKVTLRAMAVIRRKGQEGLIEDLRLYGDQSPLWT